MKKIFQKIKNSKVLPLFLVLFVILIISIFGTQVFKADAITTSYLGGGANSLLVGGGAILGNDSPATGLAVVNGISYFMGNVGIGTASPLRELHVVGEAYVSGNLGVGIVPSVTGDRLAVQGTAHFYGDVVAGYNLWGTCTFIQKSFSCDAGWALLCSEGEFMRGIHNLSLIHISEPTRRTPI